MQVLKATKEGQDRLRLFNSTHQVRWSETHFWNWRCFPKSDFRQAARFLTKNPINRPAMSGKIFFVAAVFHNHFVPPMEKKKTVKTITRWHKTLSVSAISKQVSKCSINFPHELTCEILTNQRMLCIHLACAKSKVFVSLISIVCTKKI